MTLQYDIADTIRYHSGLYNKGGGLQPVLDLADVHPLAAHLFAGQGKGSYTCTIMIIC